MSNQRLFEVGDKVCHPLWEGLAFVIPNNYLSNKEVVTVRAAPNTYRFSSNGTLCGEHEPTLRHAETGSPCVVGEPPDRFEYPLYMESKYGLIVKFTAICTATVVHTAPNYVCDAVGESSACYREHTNRYVWTPCDKPVWKPNKPTWCWVWNKLSTKAQVVLVIGYDGGMYVTSNDASTPAWDNAEPCDQEDIPDYYWPESWK